MYGALKEVTLNPLKGVVVQTAYAVGKYTLTTAYGTLRHSSITKPFVFASDAKPAGRPSEMHVKPISCFQMQRRNCVLLRVESCDKHTGQGAGMKSKYFSPCPYQQQRLVVRDGLEVVEQRHRHLRLDPARHPLDAVAFQGLHLVFQLVRFGEGALAKDQVVNPPVVL